MPRRKVPSEEVSEEQNGLSEGVVQGRSLRPRKNILEKEKTSDTKEEETGHVDVTGSKKPPAKVSKSSVRKFPLNETFVIQKGLSQKKEGKSKQESRNVKKVKGNLPDNPIVPENREIAEQSSSETFDVQGRNAPGKGKANKKITSQPEEGEDEPDKKKTKDMNEKINETSTDYSKISFNSEKMNANGEDWNLKISSWNIGGLRAWLKKDGAKFLQYEDPDILCLQEIKCSKDKIPPEAKFEGYHTYWSTAQKEGYSGVVLFSKEKPINVTYGMGIEEHDTEGRLITAEYKEFYLVTTYVPNAGKGLVTLPKRISWNVAFENYLKELDSKKPVILCGDLNVSHQEIDLSNPKTNTKNAGFTNEEREGMTQLLALGFIDTFRHLYPNKTGAYTYWTYMRGARSRNVGWRLDYYIVSERIIGQVCDSVIRSQVLGSDHCPITLLIHIK